MLLACRRVVVVLLNARGPTDAHGCLNEVGIEAPTHVVAGYLIKMLLKAMN